MPMKARCLFTEASTSVCITDIHIQYCGDLEVAIQPYLCNSKKPFRMRIIIATCSNAYWPAVNSRNQDIKASIRSMLSPRRGVSSMHIRLCRTFTLQGQWIDSMSSPGLPTIWFWPINTFLQRPFECLSSLRRPSTFQHATQSECSNPKKSSSMSCPSQTLRRLPLSSTHTYSIRAANPHLWVPTEWATSMRPPHTIVSKQSVIPSKKKCWCLCH